MAVLVLLLAKTGVRYQNQVGIKKDINGNPIVVVCDSAFPFYYL